MYYDVHPGPRYRPPTDITLAVPPRDHRRLRPGEDDDFHYRFICRSVSARNLSPGSLSVGSLLWRSPDEEDTPPSETLLRHIEDLRDPSAVHLYAASREEIFHRQRALRFELHEWLRRHFQKDPEGGRDAAFLGLDPNQSFEVHTARIAYRSRPDDGMSPQLLVSLLQSTTKPVDPGDPQGPEMSFEGGCTLIADLRERKVRYCIHQATRQSGTVSRQQFALSEFRFAANHLPRRPIAEWQRQSLRQ